MAINYMKTPYEINRQKERQRRIRISHNIETHQLSTIEICLSKTEQSPLKNDNIKLSQLKPHSVQYSKKQLGKGKKQYKQRNSIRTANPIDNRHPKNRQFNKRKSLKQISSDNCKHLFVEGMNYNPETEDFVKNQIKYFTKSQKDSLKNPSALINYKKKLNQYKEQKQEFKQTKKKNEIQRFNKTVSEFSKILNRHKRQQQIKQQDQELSLIRNKTSELKNVLQCKKMSCQNKVSQINNQNFVILNNSGILAFIKQSKKKRAFEKVSSRKIASVDRARNLMFSTQKKQLLNNQKTQQKTVRSIKKDVPSENHYKSNRSGPILNELKGWQIDIEDNFQSFK